LILSCEVMEGSLYFALVTFSDVWRSKAASQG
jgi:hypothetical protein